MEEYLKMKLVGIVGSLRKESYNRKLLNTVKSLLPEGVDLIDLGYTDVPVFNQDKEFPTPDSVVRVREAIKEADGVLFFVPEYNQGIPGALKNVIDWISRPVNFETMEKVLVGKPAGLMGATVGVSGTITPQENLRSYLTYMNVHVMPQPRATISGVQHKVNEAGELELDDITLGFVRQTAEAFVEFAKKVNQLEQI